jgi:hypothetical protein
MRSLAGVSLHCLARWYSRAFATTDAALQEDMLTLVAFAEQHVGIDGHEFSVTTTNGGSWKGHTSTTGCSWREPERVLQARTFY